MKKYEKPMFLVNYFDFTDVITTSDIGHNFIDDDFAL